MPRTARVKSSTGVYHVVNRGVGKLILFEEDEDYSCFLKIFKTCCRKENCRILAYCLMDNHVHLLIEAEKGPGIIMQRLFSAYAAYYNKKYERTGHLFQGRYWSEPVNDDRYLLAVVRYIHNNPQKAGICPKEQYPWSSWHEYVGKSQFSDPAPVLDVVGGKSSFLDFSNLGDEGAFLEAHDNRALSDKKVSVMICGLFSLDHPEQLQGLEKIRRREALSELKNRGIPTRQIARLTGISRKTISKA